MVANIRARCRTAVSWAVVALGFTGCGPAPGSAGARCAEGSSCDIGLICLGGSCEALDSGTLDEDGDGYTLSGGDCDDSDATVYPAAPELCDGLDNDCDPVTQVDQGTACWDDDGDGFCEQPPCANAVGVEIDCYDENPDARPGQVDWFSTHRGDGSFDYDCDETSTPRYQGQSPSCSPSFPPFQCNLVSAGWWSDQPSCGQSGSWVSGCASNYDWVCLSLCLDLAQCTPCWNCGIDFPQPVVQQCR